MSVELAIQLMLSLIDRAASISTLIQNAKAAGQTDLTADDWKKIVDDNDAAHTALLEAIAKLPN